MSPVRFEPTIPASARLQTYALDRTASGIGCVLKSRRIYCKNNRNLLSVSRFVKQHCHQNNCFVPCVVVGAPSCTLYCKNVVMADGSVLW
jgi:hypothetical protein